MKLDNNVCRKSMFLTYGNVFNIVRQVTLNKNNKKKLRLLLLLLLLLGGKFAIRALSEIVIQITVDDDDDDDERQIASTNTKAEKGVDQLIN